jgi:molybdopterin-containing oxidoreductase family membrane subunit
MFRCAFTGPPLYYAWMGLLTVVVIAGVGAYRVQLDVGLGVTNLSQTVSWGAYIANFTFLVGVAAAAVLLVVPTYVYHREDTKTVVLVAELMAASAIIMCLAFVTVDLGRPERFIHMMPFFGRLNFPRSMLAWDVVVLTGYLILNIHVPGYLLYMLYKGKQPARKLYLPFVFVSIFWAISIHTVTAFLYGGFGGRPFWNTAIMAPRFLISAFASGPAILLIVFAIIDKFSQHEIRGSIFMFLRRVISITLPINFFLLGCELFKEFYTDSAHSAAAHYLLFGIHGHGMLVPFIWAGLLMGITAMVIMLTPRLYRDRRVLMVGAVLCVLGVWVEKGMGLIIPGFIPSPSGELVEYTPSIIEFLVSLGIWALGALVFTVFAKVALAIQRGQLRAAGS